jgi:flavin-dependent dehydrogenase
LVLGGGPGGAATAIACAQAGLRRVVLVERESFPREHVGETLHPGVEPLLEQLGVADDVRRAGFLRHEGNWIEWAGERRFEAFGADAETGTWLGLQAWRADFDALLLARARALGVLILQPCQAVRPLHDHTGRVAGVETSAQPMTASFVVDAAGDRHWLARHLGLEIKKYSQRLTARYGYVEGACAARDDAPEIVSDARGWTWTARVRPHLYQWTRLSLLDDAGGDVGGGEVGDEAEQAGREWLPAEFRTLKRRGASRGADVTWRMVARPAGAGYFLVGDAAAVLDPASSHGVLKAITSGIMSAHYIAHIFGRRVTEREAAERYCEWIRSWFEHDVARLRELYSIFDTPAQASPDAA